MDWGKFVEWLSGNWPEITSNLIAAFAAYLALRAHKVTRSFQNPFFVLECEQMQLQQHPGVEPAEEVQLVLINRGNSFAKNVKWRANYDPFGIQSRPQTWEYIEGNGGKVTFLSGFKASSRGFPLLGSLYSRDDKAAFCTVQFVSQSGHKVKQELRLPNPHAFRRDLPQDQ